uniref:Uncharacterized protein n=1 Tax=Setaria viridis TaxID=4556 RepID=A0A4U6VLB7_SETVI|nr:uncharacterized protein LOC117843489 [Setaria viridis]TKW30481.1 hypothetical protein SEVIR_2G040500v2 [Setaria viridis]
MSSSSDDVDVYQRQGNVEVLIPDNVEGATGSSAADTASSAAPDGKSIAEKAIAFLPPEFAEMARDPKRKAKSNEPGWKYGFWSDTPVRKEFIQICGVDGCYILCTI